jgi:hypothetical protein
MGVMNKQLNLPALQGIMREFEKQNERMEMTGEIMGDAIDDAFEEEGEQEETDDLVNQARLVACCATAGLPCLLARVAPHVTGAGRNRVHPRLAARGRADCWRRSCAGAGGALGGGHARRWRGRPRRGPAVTARCVAARLIQFLRDPRCAAVAVSM